MEKGKKKAKDIASFSIPQLKNMIILLEGLIDMIQTYNDSNLRKIWGEDPDFPDKDLGGT